MIGTAGFDVRSYEDVEADPATTIQAVAIVIVSSIAAAIGVGAVDISSMLGLLTGAIFAWIVWVALTLFIGTRLLPEKTTRSNFGEILRTTGFSASIGILRIFGIIPVVGGVIFALVTIWMLLTFVVAIRQALDYTRTSRAFAVCLLGWIIHALILVGFVRIVS